MERLDTPKLEIHHWPIMLLRVYAGIFFLKYGIGKVQRGSDFGDGLAGFVSSNLENSFGFFRPVLESVVLPNKVLFAYLVGWGELLIGIALILGLATRYAALAGALMVSAFWFTKGQAFLAAQNQDSIWLMIFIVIAGLPAGRVLGLDARLAERLRFLR